MSDLQQYLATGLMPENDGQKADLLREVKDLRIDMGKKVDDVRALERQIEDYFIDHYDTSTQTGVSGLLNRVQVKEKSKPRITDWEPFYDFVVAQDRFDLMQKRIADKPIMELLEDSTEVPGVETIRVKSISLTKV